MRKFLLWPALLTVLLALPGPCRAEYLLSVSSSADVNHLHVGNSVTFDVALSGVNGNDPNTYYLGK